MVAKRPEDRLQTMGEVIAKDLDLQRFLLTLVGVFATLALVLASVGLYGLVAYSASQRTQEVGIRVALGAQTGDVLRMVVGQGTKLILAGVAIGLGAAFAATRLMRGLLYGVSATDPYISTAVPAVLGLSAMIASYVPARRAASSLIWLESDVFRISFLTFSSMIMISKMPVRPR